MRFTDGERLAVLRAVEAVQGLEMVFMYADISDIAKARALSDCQDIRIALNAAKPYFDMAKTALPLVE